MKKSRIITLSLLFLILFSFSNISNAQIIEKYDFDLEKEVSFNSGDSSTSYSLALVKEVANNNLGTYEVPIHLGVKGEYIPFESRRSHSEYDSNELHEGGVYALLINAKYDFTDLIYYTSGINFEDYNLSIRPKLDFGYYINDQNEYYTEDFGSQFGYDLGIDFVYYTPVNDIKVGVGYRSVDRITSAFNFSLGINTNF